MSGWWSFLRRRLRRAPPTPDVPEDPLCISPWKQFLVRPNGDVWPCCFWYSERALGNVNEQGFEEIWNGAPWRELRRQLLTGELGLDCRRCPVPGIGDVDDPDAHHGALGRGE